MVLVGFQYELVSLDVSEVCFEEDIPNTCEKSRKSSSVLNGLDVGNEA